MAMIGALLGLSAQAVAADQELLDILLANGSITEQQHAELSKKAAKDESKTEALMKNMAWAGKIKIKGDLRVRHEDVDDSGGAGDNRQRYRARIGVYADITDSLEAGVRMASGSSATSTNETLGDGFSNDTVFFDLAYMNWEVLDGLELIGGKFKKPWQEVSGGLVWDGDVNPEGAAVRYTGQMGNTTLTATAGHLVLDDIEDLKFSDDQRVAFGQLAANFHTDFAKALVGVSIYDYDENDQTGDLIFGGGNDSTEFSLREIFGEVGLASFPVKVYGHWVTNGDANGPNDDEDTAWLVGIGAKVDKFKASVDYRETELNAVNGAFNDSDFAGGRTDSKGFRFKAGYEIDKNFSVGATYFLAETDSLNGDRDIDTLQLDLVGKF